MSTNYNKFFNSNYSTEDQNANTVESKIETVEETIKTDDIEETIIVAPEEEVHPDITRAETTEVPKEDGEMPKPILYGINNTTKLNVRTEPNKDGDIIRVLDSKSTFEIEELDSDPEWVKVFLSNGVEGFCMKMYVAIK